MSWHLTSIKNAHVVWAEKLHPHVCDLRRCYSEKHKEGFSEKALRKSPHLSWLAGWLAWLAATPLSGFVEMKNELLCGVATVVDCIYGTKLNLMLLAISSQYFFPLSFFLPHLAVHLHSASQTTTENKARRVKFMFQICLFFISFCCWVFLAVHFQIMCTSSWAHSWDAASDVKEVSQEC